MKVKGERVPDRLERYRAKRDPKRTPEPFGPSSPATAPDVAARPFVVQEHAASRLHWDFRLELGGTLRSWAVPKGPSLDPAEKRMAVEVEDHPVEYADFEGIIPEGNYGAGAVIVWDRGTWSPVGGDPEQALRDGKLVFTLRGYKLRGEWTLVRTKPQGKKQAWLLMKHRGDPWAGAGRPLPNESVLSGRTVEEVEHGTSRAEEVLAEARKENARPLAGRKVEEAPMLAEAAESAFDDPAFIYELKYDGYRLSAERRGPAVTLRYRGGDDATALFPEIAKAVSMLSLDATLDGEVVVLDEEGRPSFQALQKRAQLGSANEVARAAAVRPATYFAFDLLAIDGLDLRPLPLLTRKRLLERIVPKSGPLRYADHVSGRGIDLLREVKARGLEGIMAKKADSPYRSGRSKAWQKIRVEKTGDFAVVGFTKPKGERTGFGALHLAVRDGKGYTYAGSVGTGFDERTLVEIHDRLSEHVRPTPPFSGPLPRGRGDTFVDLRLVVEVKFREWTEGGLLRHPVFVRLREDKRPEETKREVVVRAARPPPNPAAKEPARVRDVKVTNADKVLFPADGITKGDIVCYYREIAPFMLPYLKDRPVVLTRYPDGILGKNFFQKDAPKWRPSFMRTVRIASQDPPRDVDHFLIDDEDGLAFIANLGTIPIHVWSSRTVDLSRPDWCILDLDPKDAPFLDVVALARAAHELLDELEVPSYCKTTGQKGLHVLVPLGAQLSHDQARTFGELVARLLEREHPQKASTARAIVARGGKVYLDYLQNGHGKTIAAPYSVRPRPGAPVSTPLRWSEVNARLDPSRFTVKNALRRANRLGHDPLVSVLGEKPDLLRALERVHKMLNEGLADGARNTVGPAHRQDPTRT